MAPLQMILIKLFHILSSTFLNHYFLFCFKFVQQTGLLLFFITESLSLFSSSSGFFKMILAFFLSRPQDRVKISSLHPPPSSCGSSFQPKNFFSLCLFQGNSGSFQFSVYFLYFS